MTVQPDHPTWTCPDCGLVGSVVVPGKINGADTLLIKATPSICPSCGSINIKAPDYNLNQPIAPELKKK